MGQIPRNHPLDKLISDDSLFFLETIVPFIDYPYKKMLVLFIKYRELMCIMSNLDNRDYVSSCGFDCHPKSTEEMLSGMCDFLPGNLSSSLRQMKQMMSMMDMMNSMSPGESSEIYKPTSKAESNDLYDSVLSILNNENVEH